MNEKNIFVIMNPCNNGARKWNIMCMLYDELFALYSIINMH